MKKILLVALFATVLSSAQVHFGRSEYGNISVTVEPYSSIKEESINLTTEVELVSYFGYVKASVQVLSALKGGYIDTVGAVGLNLTYGDFENWRYYGGMRLGLIHRGSETYAMYGFEGGVDYNFESGWFVGLRGTDDWRTDFKFSGAEPKFQLSGGVRAGKKF